MNKVLEKTKEGIKYALVPNATIYECLGIKYIGPIDGHNLEELVEVINKVKNYDVPVILHVLTKKGKGYSFAEKNPTAYHGLGSFDVIEGKKESSQGKLTYSDVFGKALVRLAAKNKNIVAITAAMMEGTGLNLFNKLYPKRIFDVGIAEEHAVTFAAGLAKNGCIPVFAVYSTFLQRSYDQIIHDVCLQNLPVIFAIDRAGVVGDDGETHQGVYDFSYLSHIPNLKILAPKNKQELVKMLAFAVKLNAPCAIRYPRGAASEVLTEIDNPIIDNEVETVFEGENIALISVGAMMDSVYNVYKKLKEIGYNPSLFNARFIKCKDKKFINSLKYDYKYIFTFEDNIFTGGFGSSLNQKFVNINNKAIYNFSFPDEFIKQGTRQEIFERYFLDDESMFKKILSLIKEK